MEIVSDGPLPVASTVWQPAPRKFALTVVCRATFQLVPVEAQLSAEQDAPNEEDTYWNDDASRSLSAPSDLAPWKPRADVILVGYAFAPRRQPARSVVARLKVGEIDKAIEVFGDRAFTQEGALREGERFLRVPLQWERAAGGPETDNPVGMRLDVADSYGATAIPNLQPLGLHLERRGDHLPPIGFGPIAPRWPSRRALLGRHAATFSQGQWGPRPLPADLDLAYFMAAPPDQQLDVLRDDEPIILENLHPDHPRLMTSLPGLRPRARVERRGATQEVAMCADTLWIDSGRAICTLTWRGRVALDRPDERGRVVVELDASQRRPPLPSQSFEIEATTTLVEAPRSPAASALPFASAGPTVGPAPRPSRPPPPPPVPKPSSPGERILSRMETTPWAASPDGARRAETAAPVAPPPLMEAVAATPDPPVVEERAAPSPTARARASTREVVKLVWFDPDALPRIRKQREWRRLLGELELRLLEQVEADVAGGPLTPEVKDRQTVLEVLLRGESITADGVRQAVDAAVREDGGFEPPLAILHTELEMLFDELSALRATATAARPMASTDKRLKETRDVVDQLLEAPSLGGSGSMAESLTARLREAFAAGKRALPPDYLEAHVERARPAPRAYQKRALYDKKWVRTVIRGSAGAIPVYLPDGMKDGLPLFRRFRVRMLAELDLREDEGEASAWSVRVIALARVITQGG